MEEFFQNENNRIKYLPDAERKVTETCLQYLITTASLVRDDVREYLITPPFEVDSDFHSWMSRSRYQCYRDEHLFSEFPLSRYAGRYLGVHAASIKENYDWSLAEALFRIPLLPYMLDLEGRGYVIGLNPRMDTTQYQLLFYAFFGLHRSFSRCLSGRGGGHHAEGAEGASFVNMAQDRSRWTALLFAAAGGHTKTVQLLLDNGANVNHLTTDNCTALSSAAGGGTRMPLLFSWRMELQWTNQRKTHRSPKRLEKVTNGSCGYYWITVLSSMNHRYP